MIIEVDHGLINPIEPLRRSTRSMTPDNFFSIAPLGALNYRRAVRQGLAFSSSLKSKYCYGHGFGKGRKAGAFGV